MRVLVGCEFSGIVRDAFIALGHDAISCDLEPTERPGPHYQGDVRDLFSQHWDLAIFHPPCTRLCFSGARWIKERNLYGELEQGAQFFLDCLNAPIERICVENPLMNPLAKRLIERPHTQEAQPWFFGDPIQKTTCLWLKNLPMLEATKYCVGEIKDSIHKESPGPNRSRNRSRFFPGFAAAMAAQWGIL